MAAAAADPPVLVAAAADLGVAADDEEEWRIQHRQISDSVKTWVADLSASTRLNYTRYSNMFLRWMLENRACVTTLNVKRFGLWIRENQTLSNQAVFTSMMRSLLKHLHAEEILPRDFSVYLRKYGTYQRQKEPDAVSPEVAKQLLRSTAAKDNQQDHPPFRQALVERRSEAS